MARILITGGTGFIGANLVRRLYGPKNNITIFSKDSPHPFLKGLSVRIIKGDLRDEKEVAKAMKGQEYVYHLAASTINTVDKKDEIFDTNVRGTENVLKAALKASVKKVVYIGSGASAGYTALKEELTERDQMEMKDNIYAQSKKLGEDKVREYVSLGLNASIVLPGYVMGAGEIDPVRFGLLRSINADRIWFTFPGGGTIVAVEDLVEGLVLAMKKGRAGERYIITGQFISLYEFYNLIAKILGKKRIRFRLPKMAYWPLYMLAVFLQKVMRHPPVTQEALRWHFNYKWVSAKKAREELGWVPKIPLEESIRNTIEYYKKIGVLPKN